MVLLTTRSSRFFVVLLHLLGVLTNLQPKFWIDLFWNETGINGVNPASIRLEISDPTKHDFLETHPHWLQDSHDQKCLDPMGGWSECGDATLWRIVPKSQRHARRRQWIRWATEEDDTDEIEKADMPQSYAIQVFGDINPFPNSFLHYTASTRQARMFDFKEMDCLSRRRKDNKLVVVPCSQDRSWFWKMNDFGILNFEKPIRGSSGGNSKTGARKLLLNKKQTPDCVWRNGTETVLMSCDGRNPPDRKAFGITGDTNERVVRFQFVRPAPELASDDFLIINDDDLSGSGIAPCAVSENDNNLKYELMDAEPLSSTIIQRLPSQVDIAHVHASTSLKLNHADKPPASRITSQRASESGISTHIPRFLDNSNPILLASSPLRKNTRNEASKRSPPASNIEQQENLHTIVHDLSSPAKPFVRRMQINPYIAAAQDEKWTDPQTGLVYRTDLCEYLGHERKDVGRHTLTGVGQYTKTMLNIKVYGVGFYVSKRDVLADPALEQFAGLSCQELRESTQFFQILRTMPGFSNSKGPAGRFDRTLFLKINMQIATDTMRSSLDADWKLLTAEAKELLIGSSMKERPAGPEMLEIIESPDNPSRCSCAQIAPEEYNADPSCCARGTEIFFTWRKNGDLEVGLNGAFMDSFSRPDIAEGIFYEYLRLDNPMSFDFLDRVLDGFPSLLAPLHQIKGVATPIVVQHSHPNDDVGSDNSFLKTIGGIGEAVSEQAGSFADMMQSGVHELSNSALERIRSVGSAAKSLGEEVDRRRESIGKHVSAFTSHAISTFFPKDQKSMSIPLPGWISDSELTRISNELRKEHLARSKGLKNDAAAKNGRTIGLDMSFLSPSDVTQRLFFGLVHLYLLLLLIASFPAHWGTRTKVVVTGKSKGISSRTAWDSDLSDSEESGAYFVGVNDAFISEKEICLRKSLSYVL